MPGDRWTAGAASHSCCGDGTAFRTAHANAVKRTEIGRKSLHDLTYRAARCREMKAQSFAASVFERPNAIS